MTSAFERRARMVVAEPVAPPAPPAMATKSPGLLDTVTGLLLGSVRRKETASAVDDQHGEAAYLAYKAAWEATAPRLVKRLFRAPSWPELSPNERRAWDAAAGAAIASYLNHESDA